MFITRTVTLVSLLCLFLLNSVGCAPAQVRPELIGPRTPARATVEPWSDHGTPGVQVATRHYLIYSTMADRATLDRVTAVMEGALEAYRHLSPDVPLTTSPMVCYLFESREQWAAFTHDHTGEDAVIYLRVNRGGYTVGDWYVAYWIGPAATLSVAAHEGWHQYVARHLKGRLPPFLEEGLACLFEQVEWEKGLPRWDLSENNARMASLSAALVGGKLYPVEQLIRMHAGQVVGKLPSQIEAFYAESWAFARFLYSAEHGRYRPALRRMLADAAAGTLYDDSSREEAGAPVWNPSTSKPMLEHYLQMPLPQIARAFQAYVDQLVRESDRRGG